MGVMYKISTKAINFYLIVLALSLMTSCISSQQSLKQPSLEKYGWSVVNSNDIPMHIKNDVLSYGLKGQLENSFLYTNNKKDYLLCDKYSLNERDFCFGAWVCYNMDEYYGCTLEAPINKNDWKKNRPQLKEQ